MQTRLTTLLIAIALAVPVSSLAHDPSKHKGQQTKGEVVTVSGDRMVIKTAKGNQVILLSEKPSIERGQQRASIADLKKGQAVIVIGTTLASGEIVAKEILLSPADSPKPHSEHSAHSH